MIKRLARLLPRWSIKGRIAVAFVLFSASSVVLGMLTLKVADRAATSVKLTYDNILISNNYIRAAAGDFANLRANFEQRQRAAAKGREAPPDLSAALHSSFAVDLATAAERADAPAVTETVQALRQAETDWLAMSRKIGPASSAAEWAELDAQSRTVEHRIENVVNQVSSKGYDFRVETQDMVDHDVRSTKLGIAIAIVLSSLVALFLYRRISKPIGDASHFAREISAGTMDGEPPKERRDEIGDLIRAMVAMRTSIGSMMREQVTLREQSQARITEALEGSREGVVIVDAHSVIRYANAQALVCLGIERDYLPEGETVKGLLDRMGKAGVARSALLRMSGTTPEAEDTHLPDGRWIRNSRHRTSEGGFVALYSDITAIKDQKDQLADANGTLDAALGNMSQGLCLFDAGERLKLANSRFRALFGLSEQDCAPGTLYSTLVTQVLQIEGASVGRDLERVLRHERALLRRGRTASRFFTLGARTLAVTQQPMAEGGWIATYEDVTERKRAEAQIAFLANHDALTRLPNRTMLAGRVEEAIARARRGNTFAIHCIDLDHFKQINDTLGHAVGDQLLLAVTDRLLACVRETDTVARLGGDEFAILQTEVDSPEQVAALAQRVVEALAAPYVIDGHDITIGASVGIALSPNDGLTYGVLLKSADAALYKAKEEGRRTWRFFEIAMDENLQARHALEGDLRRAVANEEFEVFYQPLLDARSAQLRSFEALVRWRHPTRGLVPPDQFIPIAEETGIIKEIGIWVLRTACREAMRWPDHMLVAVNVSTIQLRDPDFVDIVHAALEDSGLSPDRLELEITESVFMANTNRVMPILTSLRTAGVRFAMDDFGTGYSSLSTLRAFPFDKIKIDRSFIRDMAAAEAAGQIIRTILALGKSLGMRVTAEGVETKEQLQFLVAEGCDEIQGYLVGRPRPAAEVLERLEARRQKELAAAEAAAAPPSARTPLRAGTRRAQRPFEASEAI